MSAKLQLYTLAGCILAAAGIFAVCEFRKKAPSQQSFSSGDVANRSSSSAAQDDNSIKAVITDSDYRNLQQAMTNFFSALEGVEKQMVTAQDASGTVKVMESWTTANNNLGMVMDAFAEKHPQITQGTLPPKLVDIFSRFKEKNQRYASLPEELKKLTDRFDSDPKVVAAEVKFQVSLQFFRN